MFNSNTLVFLTKENLQIARGIPLKYIYFILGIILFSYLMRSFAIWKLCSRLGVRGFLLSFLPFIRVMVYSRLGKEVTGFGPRLRLFTKFYLVIYLIGIGLFLFAPSINLVLAGVFLSVVVHTTLSFVLEPISIGLVGKSRLYWVIPLVGSIGMLIEIYKSYRGRVYVKPINYDGLFRKAEDLEISL